MTAFDAKGELERGIALQRGGRLREAEAIYRALLARYPDHPQLLSLLGVLALEGNAPLSSLAQLSRAASIDPRNASILNNLATTHTTLLNYDAAIDVLEHAIAIDPKMQEAWHNLSRVLNLSGDPDRALECARRVRRLNADHVGARLSIVRSLSQLGRFEEAEAEASQMIERWPDRAAGYIALSGCRQFDAGDPIISRAQRLLDQGRCEPRDVANLQFALGKMNDDAGDFEKAFMCFAAANGTEYVRYDQAALESSFDLLTQAFGGQLLGERTRDGITSDKPIFVVGMPRSGTTLVESILAAQPSVASAGEVPFLRIVSRSLNGFVPREAGLVANIRSLSPEGSEFLGRRYLQMLEGRINDPSKLRILDKTPHNFMELGLVALMFPNAKIVHVRRSPTATCFSCWTQNFNRSHEYTSRFENLAHHYRHYLRLMAHWRSVIGDRILEIDYESIVQDPQSATEKVLLWLGLETGGQRVDQKAALRVVGSASYWQVRQPIHRRSMQRWQEYGHHLDPLKRALEAAGIEAT